MCHTLRSFSLPAGERQTDARVFATLVSIHQKNQIIQMHSSHYTSTIIPLGHCNNLVQKEINSKVWASCEIKEKKDSTSIIANYLFIKIWQYWLCLIQKGNSAFPPVKKGKKWINKHLRKVTSPSQWWCILYKVRSIPSVKLVLRIQMAVRNIYKCIYNPLHSCCWVT